MTFPPDSADSNRYNVVDRGNPEAIARLRNAIDSTSALQGIREYLIVPSSNEICRNKGISLLSLLRSGETDINADRRTPPVPSATQLRHPLQANVAQPWRPDRYVRNSQPTTANTGSSSAEASNMKPKNPGIRTPRCAAIWRSIMFGALPI